MKPMLVLAGAAAVVAVGAGVAVVELTVGKTHHVDNSHVVQGNIDKTICVTGWTSTVRPPLSYTEPIKKTLIAQLPASLPHTTAAYELDHWVPLELGGDPRSPDNLILQLRVAYGGTAETKDAEENKLHGDVCAHRLSLAQGRAQIMADWPKARFP